MKFPRAQEMIKVKMSINGIIDKFQVSLFVRQLAHSLYTKKSITCFWEIMSALVEESNRFKGSDANLVDRVRLVSEFLKDAGYPNRENIQDLVRHIALQQLVSESENLTPLYEKVRDLGQGGFAKVCEIKISFCGHHVRCAGKLYYEGDPDMYNQEYSYLNRFDHPNVIKFLMGVRGCLFMELAAQGCLKPEALPDNFHQVLQGVVRGLRYIHSLGFVHGDIKTENILLSEDGEAKIADLGCMISVNYQQKAVVDARPYGYHYPPELRLNSIEDNLSWSEYNPKIDVWAFGVLLGDVLSSTKAVKDPFKIDFISQFERLSLGVIEPHLSKNKLKKYDPHQIYRLIMMGCVKPWKNRPSMEEILTMFVRSSDV